MGAVSVDKCSSAHSSAHFPAHFAADSLDDDLGWSRFSRRTPTLQQRFVARITPHSMTHRRFGAASTTATSSTTAAAAAATEKSAPGPSLRIALNRWTAATTPYNSATNSTTTANGTILTSTIKRLAETIGN